jgi:hypothetical protein
LSRAGPAAAQSARSVREDPSVRSAGMGGTSTAVAWSDDVNGWANPALFGYATGLRWSWNNTHLLPEIAPGVTFQTNRFGFGWGGIGLAVERHTLSYGLLELTDPQGTPIGTYEPTEDVRPLSGGISLSRVVEAIASLRGGTEPGFTRYADVALGFSRKHIRLRLAPPPYGGQGITDANDFGLLIGATPLGRSRRRPFIEVAYGFAALNYNDALTVFIGEDIADLVPRQNRHGLAARFGLPLSEGAQAGLERRFGRWIAAGMDPLLSVAVAADFARYQLGPQQRYGSGVDHVGVELTLANTLSIRYGHVGDQFMGLDHDTFGVGLGIPLADFAGARYDYARYPQTSGLGMLDRHAVAAWLDPVALVHRQR